MQNGMIILDLLISLKPKKTFLIIYFNLYVPHVF
jgi:hypothetical protein